MSTACLDNQQTITGFIPFVYWQDGEIYFILNAADPIPILTLADDRQLALQVLTNGNLQLSYPGDDGTPVIYLSRDNGTTWTLL